jgi:hypothetical protein
VLKDRLRAVKLVQRAHHEARPEEADALSCDSTDVIAGGSA